MARKTQNDLTALKTYAAGGEPAPAEGQDKKTNYNPKSLENLKTNHRPKAPTKYMQINLWDPANAANTTDGRYLRSIFGEDYEDYLYRMARYNKMTTTKYVLSLIRNDALEHIAEYNSLKTLKEYNKPHRESPNKKKEVTDVETE